MTQTWDVTAETFAASAQMIAGQRGTDELGGPLRIAQLSGQVAQLGVASLVSFIAVLSVNLGLINLFPIPVLDGGHLLFYFAEAMRGRPLPRARAGIRVPRRLRGAGRPVHLRHLERSDAYRPVPLGRRPDRVGAPSPPSPSEGLGREADEGQLERGEACGSRAPAMAPPDN